MRNIITIQHTQSEHHINGMVGSRTDWSLTEFGREQAQRIGVNLSKELRGVYTLYTSDLLRAKQTAEIVGACLGIKPTEECALRERDLGRCCGRSVTWLRENKESEEKTIDDRLFSDAESRRDVWNRLLPFYDQLLEERGDVIIVSHGDLLSVFNAMFLGLAPEALNSVDLFGQTGGVSFMSISDDGKHRVRRLSDMSYITER